MRARRAMFPNQLIGRGYGGRRMIRSKERGRRRSREMGSADRGGSGPAAGRFVRGALLSTVGLFLGVLTRADVIAHGECALCTAFITAIEHQAISEND